MKAGLSVGQVASATRTFDAADLADYAALTGDRAVEIEGRAVVPGPLLGGMISRLLGVELPGRGTNWMKQRYRFLAPAPAGVPLTATVEIVRLRADKDLVNLSTRITDPAGTLLVDGEALVMAREMAPS